MASVHDQIIAATNESTVYKAQQMAQSGTSSSSSTIQSHQFLTLLTEQLKYQDPTNPMDNSEMLAQEAQFSTLEQMEALQSGFSEFANVYKANSLIGQTVEVTVDGNSVTGKVDYADFSDSSGASVSIGGNSYPLAAVTKVYPQSSSGNTTENSTLADKIDSIADAVVSIGTGIEKIASKIAKYLGPSDIN